MSEEKSQKEKTMVLALLLFLGAGGLIFIYLGGDSFGKRDGLVRSEKFEQNVNRHLMMTNERMEIERERVAVENAKILDKPLSASRPQKAYSNDERLDLSIENPGSEIADEIGRGRKQAEVTSPHDVVQSELYNEEQAQMTSQAYREEYARQFIENARRGGYQVKLSEDLSRVISVTPIRNPSADFKVFDAKSSGRGNQ